MVVYFTRNALLPARQVRADGGLGSAFVQRDALCGAPLADGRRAGIDHVVARLGGGGWSQVLALNLTLVLILTLTLTRKNLALT